MGRWPKALKDTLAERGGFVTPTERAFIEARLAKVRATEPDPAWAGLTHVRDDPLYWQSQFGLFHNSQLWRTIETLVNLGSRIRQEAGRGLGLIVQDMTGADPFGTEVEAVETASKKNAKTKRKPARRAKKTKKRTTKKKAARKRKTAERKKAGS